MTVLSKMQCLPRTSFALKCTPPTTCTGTQPGRRRPPPSSPGCTWTFVPRLRRVFSCLIDECEQRVSVCLVG